MSEELYKKYRPKTLKEVIGQDEAVSMLNDLGKRKAIPHTLLFTGPSGTGKTTLARILKDKLKCSDFDFTEINAADDRGIDMVRSIRKRMNSAPMGGKCRVWLIDEIHSTTKDGQNSFLKLLEDTPKHVYFFLATTNPQSLLKTIITRSTQIKCKPLTIVDLKKLISTVCEKEEADVDDEVVERIAECSEGSARQALVFLHAVIGLSDKDDQLAVIEAGDVRLQGIELARALYNPKTKWKQVAEILKNLEHDPEVVRNIVLSYFRTILLSKGDAKSANIIDEFRFNFFESKQAGLALACYNVIHGGD